MRYSRWKEVAAIVLVVIVGLTVRLEDLKDWTAHPEIAMYKGEPLLTTFDGYFYLSLAKDLVEGTYDPVDYKRNVPNGFPRRFPPPLISSLAAILSKVTGASLNWVGVLLPAFLGILLLAPLYGLGRFYGGPVCAISASLMGLLSFYYVYRSSLGWFDTDCMNVTWATSITYAFLLFSVEGSRRRYLYFGAAVLLYALFLLWWDSTPAAVTVIAAVPFAISLLFFYRPPKREALAFFLVLAVGALAVLAWQGWDLPLRIVKRIYGHLHYISTKEAEGLWPAIGATISEQSVPSFREVVFKTIGTVPAFAAACIGLAWLFYWRPKETLFLSVSLVLGGFSFFFAKRFLIFMAPVVAIGVGFFVARLWGLRERYRILTVITPLVVVSLIIVPLKQGMEKDFWPKEPPHLIDGFVYASSKTPEDAILWAWWDHGYPIQYFARRGTVADGSLHDGQRSSYNGLPLATNSQRLAANFMRFYAAHGYKGPAQFYEALGGDVAKGQNVMIQILSKGPEKAREILTALDLSHEYGAKGVDDWLRFFFPEKSRPVYLFLDWRLTITAYWWFWLGSWDVSQRNGIHPFYAAFYGLKLEGDTVRGQGLEVDLKKGVAAIGDKMVQLKQVTIIDEKGPRKKIYPVKEGLYFEFIRTRRFGALMDRYAAESVFNQLFMRHLADSRYFRPVRLKTPSHQIWEVRGDSL